MLRLLSRGNSFGVRVNRGLSLGLAALSHFNATDRFGTMVMQNAVFSYRCDVSKIHVCLFSSRMGAKKFKLTPYIGVRVIGGFFRSPRWW